MEQTDLSAEEIVTMELTSSLEVKKKKIPDELLCNICKEEKFSTVTSGKLRVCDNCLGIIIKPIKKNQIIERNDPCPCGSGKKSKKCCG